ncbi:MAG: hypothetical protein ACE5DX_05455 [Candidatus Dojkabacteria bacterium]
MPNTTTNWDLWNKRIDSFIEDEEGQRPEPVLQKLFNTDEKADNIEYQEQGYSSFGPMVAVGESGDAEEDDPLQGYLSVYQLEEYRKRTKFSSTLIETGRDTKVENLARDMPRLTQYSRDLYSMSMFRQAFDTTRTWGDGKPLVSTAHPRKDLAGTQRNTFLDGIQLPMSYEAVEALSTVQDDIVSNSGNLMSVGLQGRNKILLCGTKNKRKAFDIAGVQTSDERPDTADRATNFFKRGDNYDVLVTKFISWNAARQAGETTVAKTVSGNYFDDMWGIVDADLAQRYNRFMEMSEYPKFDEEVNKNNQDLHKFAYDKYMYGNSGFFSVAMSKGDSTTYTG